MRQEIETLSRFPKEPNEMTLSEAAKWSNKLRALYPYDDAETRLVSEQYLRLVTAIGEREGLPPGLSAYIIDELAFTLRVKPQEMQ